MANREVTGSELKRRFEIINANRVLAGEEVLYQRHIAAEMEVSQVSVSLAVNDRPGLDSLRRRIAEYLDSLEQGKKPLPNRMYKKTLVTR